MRDEVVAFLIGVNENINIVYRQCMLKNMVKLFRWILLFKILEVFRKTNPECRFSSA